MRTIIIALALVLLPVGASAHSLSYERYIEGHSGLYLQIPKGMFLHGLAFTAFDTPSGLTRFQASYDASYRLLDHEYFTIASGLGYALNMRLRTEEYNIITATVTYPEDIDFNSRPYLHTLVAAHWEYLQVHARIRATWDEYLVSAGVGLRFP